MEFGVVAIGRNEGERLRKCLGSLTSAVVVVYVDSGSTDGSAEWARSCGADVVELDVSIPFTAARARNAGLRRLKQVEPTLAYVQFIDGDCELYASWPQRALAFLASQREVAVVTGRLQERNPESSVYNWLCQREWDGPSGDQRACGGIAMMRIAAVEPIGGFREDVIAAEDDELCVRLRAHGWRIWRLDTDMALHDAAIRHFGQWWRRALRSGYAFAHGSYLHGAPPERHFVWESRRAWIWGIWLPLACLAAGLLFGPWGWAIWLVYPIQVLRQTMRNRGSLREGATLALFQSLSRFPEALGQIKFLRDRLLGRQARLIEYK